MASATDTCNYHKIVITHVQHNLDDEKSSASKLLLTAIALRNKYVYKSAVHEKENTILLGFKERVRKNPFEFQQPPRTIDRNQYTWTNGIVELQYAASSQPSYQEFTKDLETLYFSICCDKIAGTLARKRLRLLDLNFHMHAELNGDLEIDDATDDVADFSTITKVDNHIHAASAMTQKEMLGYIRLKYTLEGDAIVQPTGESLRRILENCGISDITKKSTESLRMAASSKMFSRFDQFNYAYNPFGKSELRNIFMKTSNFIEGRYFAELLRDVVFPRITASSSAEAMEPRLSIYGISPGEWNDLAHFFCRHRLLDIDTETGEVTNRVKWMVQVPRLCNIYMGSKYASFAEMLRNIFDPLFAATLYPEAHPELHIFLSHVGAIDSVDDESVFDPLILGGSANSAFVPPEEYTDAVNPPYSYWAYYMAANLRSLNYLREQRGLNTFAFKPHCGEAGQNHHLATGFLLADSINHGIKLEELPVLEYLYYLTQIGMGLCPLSNDALFLKIHDSPIGRFHRIGLRVCLGTDDPLQFHTTTDPLVEEYILAARQFQLNTTDMSEIARNSVLNSSFDHEVKALWLGDSYTATSLLAANDKNKTNLTDIRCAFREENLTRELAYLSARSQEGHDLQHSPSTVDVASVAVAVDETTPLTAEAAAALEGDSESTVVDS